MDTIDQCIATCRACARSCLECASRLCLHESSRRLGPTHFRLLWDCAEICQTAANFMERDSPLHHATCAACAEVCDACARECGEFEDEPHQECAALCARAANECRALALSVSMV